MEIEDLRRFYAEEIRAVSNVRTEALAEAFARVRREDYLGAGPWQKRAGCTAKTSACPPKPSARD